MVGVVPRSTVAQVTEPLLPLPAPAARPQAPAAPGEPTTAGQSVTQRPRPEYDPLGLHLGSFFWFPRAELGEAYNSNIFATPIATSDFITTLRPGFDLLSNFPRNAINLHAGAESQFYARNPAQNTQDGFVNVDGRLDVTTGSAFYGSAQYAHLYIPRTSVNSPGNAAEPVTYNDFKAQAGYRQGGRRFSYQTDLAVDAAQYNAVPLIGGGILPQSSQDTIISEAALRANYELVPDYLGYIRVAGDLYDYYRSVSLNSKIYRADIGLQLLPRHIIYGEVYAGYLTQRFNVSNLGSTTVADGGARLVWDVTRLTTLTLNGVRSFIPTNPTIGTIGSGYLASVVTLTGDHEMLRNLLLKVNAGYENDSYQGVARTDNIFTAGAGVRYLLNRNLFLGGTYTYQRRTSSATGGDYIQNVLMLRLGTQF